MFFSDDVKNASSQEITDFFLNYIRNDNLGMIANAHLVFADFSEEGARCEECLQLAALHSTAVDFPKSGVPAEIPKARKRLPYGISGRWMCLASRLGGGVATDVISANSQRGSA